MGEWAAVAVLQRSPDRRIDRCSLVCGRWRLLGPEDSCGRMAGAESIFTGWGVKK